MMMVDPKSLPGRKAPKLITVVSTSKTLLRSNTMGFSLAFWSFFNNDHNMLLNVSLYSSSDSSLVFFILSCAISSIALIILDCSMSRSLTSLSWTKDLTLSSSTLKNEVTGDWGLSCILSSGSSSSLSSVTEIYGQDPSTFRSLSFADSCAALTDSALSANALFSLSMPLEWLLFVVTAAWSEDGFTFRGRGDFAWRSCYPFISFCLLEDWTPRGVAVLVACPSDCVLIILNELI